MIANTLPLEPDRQPAAVAMDRLRRAGPGARRLRQGRDRPGHPDRADTDRRRGAGCGAGADQSRVRPDRRRRRTKASPLAAIRSRSAAPRSASSAPRCARCAWNARPRALQCDAAHADDRGRARPARRTGHRPRLLVAGRRHRSRTQGDRHGAGQAARRLPDRRPEPAARSIFRPRCAASGFIHDIRQEGMLHARVLRQPWRGADLAELDEAKVQRGRRIADRRSCASASSSPLSPQARLQSRARRKRHAALAAGRAASRRRTMSGTADWLKRQTAQSRTRRDRIGRRRAGWRYAVAASYTRPFLTYGSIGTACALARVRRRRADRLVALPGAGAAARLDRQGARPSDRQSDRAPSPGRRRLRTQLRRRCRLRRSLHRHCACPAARFASSGRERTSLPARRSARPWRSTCSAVLDADGKPADWSIEIWSPPHVQRPGINGNAGFAGLMALPDAPALKPISDVPDERGGGATRNALPIYDLPRHRLIHHMLPRGAAAHLVAARARRLGQCLCHRILHR